MSALLDLLWEVNLDHYEPGGALILYGHRQLIDSSQADCPSLHPNTALRAMVSLTTR